MTKFEQTIGLFEAIYQGNIDEVQKLASRELINFQLTSTEKQALDKLFQPIQGEDETRFELGMTPLLLALSLERLEIAKYLLSEFANKIDVTLKNFPDQRQNEWGIDPLYMLLMVDFGEGRYGKNGEKLAGEKSPSLDGDLDVLFDMIIQLRVKHDQTLDISEDAYNIVDIAFQHDKPELVIKLFTHFPHEVDDLMQHDAFKRALPTYAFDESLTPEENLAKLYRFKIATPHCLSNDGIIKQICDRYLSGASLDVEAMELLSAHLQEVRQHPEIKLNFEGYLSQRGANLPGEVKALLRAAESDSVTVVTSHRERFFASSEDDATVQSKLIFDNDLTDMVHDLLDREKQAYAQEFLANEEYVEEFIKYVFDPTLSPEENLQLLDYLHDIAESIGQSTPLTNAQVIEQICTAYFIEQGLADSDEARALLYAHLTDASEHTLELNFDDFLAGPEGDNLPEDILSNLNDFGSNLVKSAKKA